MFFHHKNSLRKIFFLVGCVFLGTFSLEIKTSDAASIWGTDGIWEMFNIEYQEMIAKIEGSVVGAARNAAAQIMSQQIYLQIGGGRGGRPLFITDFRTALIADPSVMAVQTVNDYLLSGNNGRGSQLNYISKTQLSGSNPACLCLSENAVPGDPRYSPTGAKCTLSNGGTGICFSKLNNSSVAGTSTTGDGISSSNITYINNDPNWQIVPGGNAQYATLDSSTNWLTQEGVALPTVTVSSINDGARIYLNGSNNCQIDVYNASGTALSLLSTLTAGGRANYPIARGACAASILQQALIENQDIARTQSIANQGYISLTDENGNIKTPGISLKGLVDAASNVPTTIVASGKNLAEFAAGAAGTLATGIINSLINQGIAQTTNAVNGALSSATGGMIGISSSRVGNSYLPRANTTPVNVQNSYKQGR